MGLYRLFLSAYFFDPDSQEKERKKERKEGREEQPANGTDASTHWTLTRRLTAD